MRLMTATLVLSCFLCLQAMAAPPLATAPFSPTQAQKHQHTWAEHLGLPVKTTNSIGMKLILIPPGQLTMGSPLGEEWHRKDEVQHEVTLSQAFYMGTAEVTQGEWKSLMPKNPSFFVDDALPVDTVNWLEAVAFCQKLSEKEHAKYRLPTEAEWEHACRAGTTTPFFTGQTINTDQANYDGNYSYAGGPKGVFRETTTTAGTFAANPWGVYDMHGNVWEWCADWYSPYPSHAVKDPTGPAQGAARIVRGGCWINFPAVCRSANRGKTVPAIWNFNFGFRVVRTLDQMRAAADSVKPPTSIPLAQRNDS